jgi:biotin carboxyl carrier protein
MIYSEVSGTLIKILVSKNQIIEEDTDLLVIECMKMHIPITSNKRGKIIDIFIKEGDLITEGDKLLDINYDI